MIAYRTAKQNVDKILGLTPEAQEQNREQKPERWLQKTPVPLAREFFYRLRSCWILFTLPVADHRALFDFLPNLPPLQSKHHIRGAFKKALAFFPAHAAPAMLQADKLLLHFPAAVRTNLVAAALLPGRGRSFLFGRRGLWNPMLLDAGFISGQFGEERPVYLVIGNPYRKRFYLIVDSGGDLFSSFIPRHFPVFLVMLTDGPEHPFWNFRLLLLPQILIGFVWLGLHFVSKRVVVYLHKMFHPCWSICWDYMPIAGTCQSSAHKIRAG